MTKDMTLFEYLQKRADDKMLTYYEFAKEMKMSPNTLYNLKHKKPTIRTYRKIAAYLNEDPFELREYPIKK